MKVYGSGHVVAHNSVAYFHDGIDHATYGTPDGSPDAIRDRLPVSIDIYNNDIRNVDDNCIEADGAAFNVRVLRNRCFNQAHRALSATHRSVAPCTSSATSSTTRQRVAP